MLQKSQGAWKRIFLLMDAHKKGKKYNLTQMCIFTHWSVIEHRTRKQDIEVGNYTTQNLENMADLHGES